MVGDSKMENYANFIEILVASKPGDKLVLKVDRAGTEMTIEVVLDKPRGG
jgi:S1-C subfamily serine protease